MAQESSSKPNESPAGTLSETPSSGGPSAALRAVLTATCSQNQADFVRFLTARNKEAFSRMSPPARVALMKRFVLLNEPGKPTISSNPAGRPIVRCQTPDVTTEMQIGGAELRDNIAFLPMELRDATDSTGEDVHQVVMGFVREDGEWKLLSLGLLLLDLPALEVEWDAAEIESTEKSAIESVYKVAASLPQQICSPARILGEPGPAASRHGQRRRRRAARWRPRERNEERLQHSLRDSGSEHPWRSGKIRAVRNSTAIRPHGATLVFSRFERHLARR